MKDSAPTPQQAEAAIDARLIALPAEARPLEACIGAILREDIYAERDNPPFDRVCMDGIAIDSAAFRPAELDGDPLPYWLILEFVFSIDPAPGVAATTAGPR